MLPEIVETVNVRDHLDVLTSFFKFKLAFPHVKLDILFVFKIISICSSTLVKKGH